MTDPDLVVIGGGTAALAVARSARRRKASVVLITEGQPGGDCTFSGCIPSKTLLAASHLPFTEAISRVHRTVHAVAADEDEQVLMRDGIQVVSGHGIATGPGTVTVDARTIRTTRLVIATGSAPLVPAIPGLSGLDYLTNESLFELTERPGHLLVLGGGAIGCEMAQAFRRLGSEVTIIDEADRLLGKEERSASLVVQGALVEDGIDVRVNSRVDAASATTAGVRLETSGGPVEGSHLLVAVGRRPRTTGTDALDLKRSGTGAIEVDLRMRTSMRGVFAAGDVTGRLPFTHAADEMGRVAAANALGRIPVTFKESAVPWVTFTDPEVARIGLTEAQAAHRVSGARVVELPLDEVDRARTADRTDGFLKIIVGPRPVLGNAAGGRVVGATIVAERAGEMIAELALAVRTGMFAGRLAQTSHAYPTWSVAVQQAAGQLFGVGRRTPHPARADR